MTRAEALAALKAGAAELTPGQRVTARLFRPEDAPGVARLFHQIYGDDYPADEPYVPELLCEANRTGRTRTVVAATDDGSIVAQAAFFRSSPPNPRMYEYGQMLVDRAYRGSSAVMRLHQFALKHMFGRLDGVDAEFGEAVCHHLVTQKMSRGVAYFECGLEPGLMPESAYAGEGVLGRASCLLHVRVDNPGDGRLFLPECWRAQVEALLPQWRLPRDVAVSPSAGGPPGEGTELSARRFAFAGVTRLNVACAGTDFPARLDAELARSAAEGHALVQVFLCLGDPASGCAAEELRRAGFFFGGFMPLWFGAAGPGPDALLAQRFLAPQTLAEIRTQSEAGAQVVQLVLEDMARAGREFGSPQPSLVPLPGVPRSDGGAA